MKIKSYSFKEELVENYNMIICFSKFTYNKLFFQKFLKKIYKINFINILSLKIH